MSDHRQSARTAPAFHILRQLVIHQMARDGVPTVDIAKKLKHSRSFIIKQTTITLKPRNAQERLILKLATEHAGAIQRTKLGGLLHGEDVVTVLAGGERPKLGPLSERRAQREKKAEKKVGKKPAPAAKAPVKKAEKKTPKAAPKAKPAPKPPVKVKATKPEEAMAKATRAAAEKAKEPRESAPKPARKRPSAKDLSPPLPAAKLKEDAPAPAAPTSDASATEGDLMEALGLGAPEPSPDTPV